jgi:large subunit ribosomal protein L4e
MKISILNITKTRTGETELPEQFYEPVRPDLIKRAVLATRSHKRQPYGAKPEAGKRASGYLTKRRNRFRSTYGIGQSRTPRKVMSVRGERFNWEGAIAPQTKGGRRAHPPKAEKNWKQKINIKERRKAIRSAIAATVHKELVMERGHKTPDSYPFIIEDKIENIEKTSELKKTLEKLGFTKELERTKEKKIRAGRGKMRGRKYKKRTGLLIVTSKKCDLEKAAKNILGVTVKEVNKLDTETLAPGTKPGRLTMFTNSSIKRLQEEKLFTKNYKGINVEKKEVEKEKAVIKTPKKAITPKKITKKPVKKTPKKKVRKK